MKMNWREENENCRQGYDIINRLDRNKQTRSVRLRIEHGKLRALLHGICFTACHLQMGTAEDRAALVSCSSRQAAMERTRPQAIRPVLTHAGRDG